MPKRRLFHLKKDDATKWAIRTWNAWAVQRDISIEEQQLNCITDLSAIKIEEMSEQQLIYFIPRFILEVRKKIAKNTHLKAYIKCSVEYKGKSKKKPTVNLFSPTYTDVSKTLVP